jgi:hypothetical protein
MSTAQPLTEPSTTQRNETAVAMNESRKVDDLWFIDGTLVLLAGTSRFRVYGGLLAKSSPVFQDMLAFPQPSDVECIDGCPVVRLEDKEQDLRYFLKAFCDHELVHLHDHCVPFSYREIFRDSFTHFRRKLHSRSSAGSSASA